MSRRSSRTRNALLGASAVSLSIALSACQGDQIIRTYTECTDEPGCQASAAIVAPAVIESLEDAGGRVTATMPPMARVPLEAALGKLERALVARDIGAGRVALVSVLTVIGQLEVESAESRPDLGAVRLGLVPAARSLGLSVSIIDAPLY